MKEITVKELKDKKDSGEDFQLLDVREPDEVEMSEIGGHHIPMAEVMERMEEIRRDIPVVVHCGSGARSSAVITALENHYNFENLYNLKGGIEAWWNEVDPSIAPE